MPTKKHSRSRAILLKWALAGMGTLGGLLLLELGLRVQVALQTRSTALAQNPPAASHDPARTLMLYDLIQQNPNPRIIYSLRPGLVGIFRGGAVAINAAGWRGGELAIARPARTVRIVGLGDSVMFGWGVNEEETYLRVVTKALAKENPTINWQLINSAVPGYNTAMEIATFKERLLAYKPDLVILGYVGNDDALPNFLYSEDHGWNFGRSYLFDWLQRKWKGVGPAEIAGLGNTPESAAGAFESAPEKVPERYREMVGATAVSKGLAELHALAASNSFQVVVFSHSLLPENVRLECTRLGFEIVEAGPATDDYARGLPAGEISRVTISERDPHPSAMGHQICADAMLAMLRKHAIPEKLAQEALRRGE